MPSLDAYSRDRLVKVLEENCTSQPWRDVDSGRGLIEFGVILTIVGVVMWLAFSAFVYSQGDDPDHGIHYVRDAIESGEKDGSMIAFLVQMQERDRVAADMADSRNQGIFGAVLMVLAPVVTIGARNLFSKGRRTVALDGFAELARLPDRPPVLLLRSFRRDPLDKPTLRNMGLQEGNDFEMAVVRELRKLGPVIALGKPGETLPPVGAARFYASDEKWQSTVLELLADGQLVLFMYDSTPGLLWEVEAIIERVKPSRFILCIPKQIRGRPNELEAWTRFVGLTKGLFPKPLPADPGDAFFIRFEESWNPIAVGPRPRSMFPLVAIRRALRAALPAQPV